MQVYHTALVDLELQVVVPEGSQWKKASGQQYRLLCDQRLLLAAGFAACGWACFCELWKAYGLAGSALLGLKMAAENLAVDQVWAKWFSASYASDQSDDGVPCLEVLLAKVCAPVRPGDLGKVWCSPSDAAGFDTSISGAVFYLAKRVLLHLTRIPPCLRPKCCHVGEVMAFRAADTTGGNPAFRMSAKFRAVARRCQSAHCPCAEITGWAVHTKTGTVYKTIGDLPNAAEDACLMDLEDRQAGFSDVGDHVTDPNLRVFIASLGDEPSEIFADPAVMALLGALALP